VTAGTRVGWCLCLKRPAARRRIDHFTAKRESTVFTKRRADFEIPLNEIIARIRILVIDDQDFPYVKLFKRDGYNVEKWKDVDKLTQIEQGGYDLILLDLQGVGSTISVSEQGLGVLRHIKKVRPTQLVIAYSNAEFPLQYQPFFELADGVLQKSADYLDFKRKVDELLQANFSIGFQIRRIEREFSQAGLSPDKGAKLARRALQTRDTETMRSYLTKHTDDAVTVDRVIAVAQLAISIAGLWKS
jgi:CheY-like chemotaxis protein